MTSGPTRVPHVLTPALPSETPPEVLGDPHLQCWNELQLETICSKDPESQTGQKSACPRWGQESGGPDHSSTHARHPGGPEEPVVAAQLMCHVASGPGAPWPSTTAPEQTTGSGGTAPCTPGRGRAQSE